MDYTTSCHCKKIWGRIFFSNLLGTNNHFCRESQIKHFGNCIL